ncbi:hypothetical protein PVAP13_1KG020100 [Panicum virgatum]|uniref:Uncharacterized protein n=1 Tax=Panicum virgatum TaxID=38727 RepID=A0A8T0X7T0_PANVG|nr:hypothetical protein PVAP13_1KG020100 [Panicum virgatum]
MVKEKPIYEFFKRKRDDPIVDQEEPPVPSLLIEMEQIQDEEQPSIPNIRNQQINQTQGEKKRKIKPDQANLQLPSAKLLEETDDHITHVQVTICKAGRWSIASKTSLQTCMISFFMCYISKYHNLALSFIQYCHLPFFYFFLP